MYTCFIVCILCLNALIQISRFYETAKCDEFLFDANRICYKLVSTKLSGDMSSNKKNENLLNQFNASAIE